MTNVKSNLVPDENQSNQAIVSSKVYEPALIKRLVKYQMESGKSWSMLGDQIGVSSSILSQWKSKKYNGNVGEINSLVEKYLRVEEIRQYAIHTDLDYVKTENNEQALNVLNATLVHRVLSSITGDTGTSKTTSINQFLKNNNCIYIHCNRTYRWPIEYLRKIHKSKFVGKDGIGSMNFLADEIIRELKGKNLMIIVDQADYLNLAEIDVFRTIQEEANIGVVYVGLPGFLTKLRRGESEVRQVRDRLKFRLELKACKQSELKEILIKNFPQAAHLSNVFVKLSNGSTRILSSLIFNTKKMIESKKYALDEITVNNAAKLLERSVVE